MTDITDPQSVRFCNDRLRADANDFAKAYYQFKTSVDQWFAQNLDTSIPNNAADELIDGAAEDGRPVLSGADVHNIVTRMTEIINDLEANANAKLNTILAVATDTTP